LSGRRVNDMMGMFVANRVVKLMINKGHKVNLSKVLILGITFKEDCPDIRNSKVIDIHRELVQFGVNVDVFDPHADANDVFHEYGIKIINQLSSKYDAIVLAVSHKEFLKIDLKDLCTNNNAVIFDTKSFLERSIVDARL
jgi:UDP-N-acetyl-D-galactosamine dehydrogenase